MVKTFLAENGFGCKASAANTFLKNMSQQDVTPVGNLHAHIKVTFTDEGLTKFKIHGTARRAEDAKELATTDNSETVGRAIWVYYNRTYRSPQEWSWWIEEGGVNVQQLKSYCRQLADQVIKWTRELRSEGCEWDGATTDARKIRLIGIGS